MSTSAQRRRPSLHEHLFGPGPKRILALDGGGTLGVIEIAFLEKIETVLREQHNDPELRLCDYFDLIGGTSTGALIATALAMGKSAREVKEIYFEMAEAVFKGRSLHVPGYHDYVSYPFPVGALTEALKAFVGDEELQSEKLLTGLAIVAKRLDTATPWVLTNNPKARYWQKRDPGDTFIDNKSYKLSDVLRASTAAPLTFIPKAFPIAFAPRDARGHPIGRDEIGVFVDGGLSPHSNPALKLVMVAAIKRFGFGWSLGADELEVISIGTGWHRPRIKPERAESMKAYEAAAAGARGAIWDAQVHALTQLQWMSKPHSSWFINSEIDDLSDDVLSLKGMPPEGLLSFQRYDVSLDRKWLESVAGHTDIVRSLSDGMLAGLTSDTAFTNPSIMPLAYGLAAAVAEKNVAAEQFADDFGLGRQRAEIPSVLLGAVNREAQQMRNKTVRPFVVGVVGHRWNKLPQAELSRIKRQLEEACVELQAKREACEMVLMTGLAEGTDQIAAHLALARGWSLVASLPFSRTEYAKDFQSPAALEELSGLLERAQRVIEAPRADAYPDRDRGYAEQGRGLVGAADALVTVWDGKDAAGLGGTAEVIAAAVAKGTRVYWISTEAGAALRRL